MLGSLAAKAGKRSCEAQHLVELLLVAPGSPAGVVEVLAPTGGVRPDGLDVPERVRADPHLSPGGRNDELADALEGLGILDPLALLVQVLEATAPPPAEDSRSRAVDAAKAWHSWASSLHLPPPKRHG